MSVLENLQMGAVPTNGAHFDEDVAKVFALFPRLKERQHQRGGTLSGGEQQMLCIGRALMARPRLLLLDEPSLGLAPLLVKQIFSSIVEINREQGLTILLVEQNAYQALKIAHRGYVLATGRVVLEGTGRELLANPEIRSRLSRGRALSERRLEAARHVLGHLAGRFDLPFSVRLWDGSTIPLGQDGRARPDDRDRGSRGARRAVPAALVRPSLPALRQRRSRASRTAI